MSNPYKSGLYIHWPFCLKKCPYCDFNSYAFKFEPEIWVKALIKELTIASKIFNIEVQTIFFGGGTPSLIPPAMMKELIECIYKNYKIIDNVEITLEVNPSSLETKSLEEFLSAGINRFSFGIQSLSDENLKFLGRLHNAKEAVQMLKNASEICDNVSADFIYALPSDTLETWQKDLEKIFELANDLNLKHLSLYQLTIEENTNFEQMVKSKVFHPLDDDIQSLLYEHTFNFLDKNNWDFYEISNAARKIVPRGTFNKNFDDYWKEDFANIKCDDYKTRKAIVKDDNYQFRSLHNLGYWNYLPYLGIGPGAHSRMLDTNKRFKFFNKKNPYKWKDYADNLNESNFFDDKEDYSALSDQDQFYERFLMGMRLSDGFVIFQSEMKYVNLEKLNQLIDHGFVNIFQESDYSMKLKVSLKARMCLNSIMKFLLH